MITASVPVLIGRTSERLERVEHRLGELSPRAVKTREGLTKRAESLRDQINELRALGSVESQVRFYEKAPSPVRLIRLGDIPNIEERTAVWYALRSSPFKRFQELFCDPPNFRVPEYRITKTQEDGKEKISVRFDPQVDVHELSVIGCLVSPDRMSDHLVSALRLVKFPEGTTPLDRLKAKAQMPVINSIKAWWDCAKPLSKSDFRIMVLQDLSPEVKGLFPDARPLPIGYSGSLIYSSEDKSKRTSRRHLSGGPKSITPRQAAFYPTEYEGYRKTLYSANYYKREQKGLAEVIAQIETAVGILQDEWKASLQPSTKAALAGRIKRIVGEALDKFEKSIDRKKAKAVEYLERAKEVKDCLGRVNPRATAEILTPAFKQLQSRLNETHYKNSFNEIDNKLLWVAINSDAKKLAEIRRQIAANASSVFSSTQRVPAGEALVQICSGLSKLEKIERRPFLTYAALILAGQKDFTTAWTARRMHAAKSAVIKMYISSKLFSANVILESIKETLIVAPEATPQHDLDIPGISTNGEHSEDSKDWPLGKIRKDISNLKKVLNHRILPGIQVPEYETIHRTLQRQIETFADVVGSSRDFPIHSPIEEKQAFCDRLREALDEAVKATPEMLAWRLMPRTRAAA